MRTYKEEYQHWLDSPALNEQEWEELNSIAGDEKEIESRFFAPLSFGTAGLRATLGAGPNRMNRVVVSQAAAGLARWLVANGHRGERVIVGYDARYNSDVFARDTA